MGKKRRWSDLTDTQKTAIVLLGTLQVILMAAALWDIHHRSTDEIYGSKRTWKVAAFLNFIGPAAYFLFGRKNQVLP